MKHIAWMGLLAVTLFSSVGCCAFDKLFSCRPPCGSHHMQGCGAPACGPMGCEDGACASGGCEAGGNGNGALFPRLHHHHHGQAGGMGATVAYPYYTTRGPRDWFACDPGHPRN